MAKKQVKKKRNKKYRGEDAASNSSKPAVTKISVPQRSKLGRWWNEYRKPIARRLAVIGVIILFYGLFQLIF